MNIKHSCKQPSTDQKNWFDHWWIQWGGGLGTRAHPLRRSNFFHFHAVSEKILPNNSFCFKSGGWRPHLLSGKSWIRHCWQLLSSSITYPRNYILWYRPTFSHHAHLIYHRVHSNSCLSRSDCRDINTTRIVPVDQSADWHARCVLNPVVCLLNPH